LINPYEKLNLSPDCTDEELEARFQTLRAQYSEDRFKEGEEGRIGAVNLEELVQAYNLIKEQRAPKVDEAPAQEQTEQKESDPLDTVDALIKENKIDQAQALLDDITARTGRWHYLQAIIYYKRNWFSDSLRQLDIAINMEPNNAQYKKSRELLAKNMNGMPPPGAEMPPPEEMGRADTAMGLSNCCTGLCLADCCCNSVRCCGCG